MQGLRKRKQSKTLRADAGTSKKAGLRGVPGEGKLHIALLVGAKADTPPHPRGPSAGTGTACRRSPRSAGCGVAASMSRPGFKALKLSTNTLYDVPSLSQGRSGREKFAGPLVHKRVGPSIYAACSPKALPFAGHHTPTLYSSDTPWTLLGTSSVFLCFHKLAY